MSSTTINLQRDTDPPELLPQYFDHYLLDDFSEHLKLPENCCNSFRHCIGNVVTLITTRGYWKVFVDQITSETGVCFKHGWIQFAEEHALRSGFHVEFTKVGNLTFNVDVHYYTLDILNYKKLPTDPVEVEGLSSFYLPIQPSHKKHNAMVHLPRSFTDRVRLYEKVGIHVLDPRGISWPIQLKQIAGKKRAPRVYMYKGWNQFYAANEMEVGQIWEFQFIRYFDFLRTAGFKAVLT